MAFSQGIGWGIGKHRGRAIEKDFVMEVDTTIAGALPDNQFQLRTHVGQGYTVNYDLTTSDGQSFTGLTSNQTITFPAPGVYTLKITGTFPGTNYGANNESKKIVDIKNWGKIQWRRAYSAFENAQNLTTFSASDYPDFSLLDGTGMRQMFQNCTNINADFSKWDVSTVATFDRAFNLCSSFNNDSVCNWDTSASVQFNNCFNGCTVFDQDLSNWNVSNATSFGDMFLNAYAYNNGGQALTWTLGSGAISLTRMFGNTSFNQDISGWGTSSVLSMSSMFQGSAFNNPSINNWDTSSVTTMRYLFAGTPFNQDISGWDVSSVTDVYTMFNGQFNQPIGAWNLTSCTNLESMFYSAYAFEQDLSAWDVSGVTKMTATFSNMGASERSLNIGGWNTSSVENMQSLLSSTRITDDLSGWDVSSCTNFQTLTPYGKIYFDLSLWAVQGPVNLNNMIRDTYTDQSIIDQWNFKDWDISQCISLGTQFALLETLTTNNYDQTLISWAAQAPVNALTAHFGFSKYTQGGAASAARNTLINTYGWTIIDGGGIAAPFAFTVQTDNVGTSAANQFTIPITSATPYNISTSDGQSITGATGATTLTFPSAGTYTVSITDSCEGWQFNNGGDKLKLLNISNWGVFKNTAVYSFYGAQNLTCSAVDAPINAHTTMRWAFIGCSNFNGAIGNWDVSNVTDFESCFHSNYVFNQPLNDWDVSSATTFLNLFWRATLFNQPLNNWDTSSVTSMNNMFSHPFFTKGQFNQDISSWDVSNVTNFGDMFNNTNFNQDLSSWNVSSLTVIGGMFAATPFNYPLNNWVTSSVTSLEGVFAGATSFNQDLSSWDVSNVTNLRSLFTSATSFNQDISGWNVSSVTNLERTFNNAGAFSYDISGWSMPNLNRLTGAFGSIPWNPNISGWDVSNVLYMDALFYGNTANITDDFSGWNTSNVVTLESFGQASNFNGDISAWDVSSVTSLRSFMYGNVTFSGTLSSWNTSNVTTMVFNPFYQTFAYDDDLGGWDVSKVSIINSFFKKPGFSTSNYNSLLVGWEASLQAAYPGGTGYPYTISVSFDTSTYTLGSAAETARTSLINTYGWTITDGGGIAPGPSYVYSVYDITGNATNSIMISNDSLSEIDIPFNAGFIDTSLITSHSSGNYSTVTTFYDQVGGSDLTESTKIYQPRITDASGTSLTYLDDYGERVGLNNLTNYESYDLTGDFIFQYVMNDETQGNNQRQNFSHVKTGNNISVGFRVSGSNYIIGIRVDGVNLANRWIVTKPSQFSLYTFTGIGGVYNLYINNVLQTSDGGVEDVSGAGPGITLGYRGGQTSGKINDVQTFSALYNNDLSAFNVSAYNTTYMNIHGL